MNRRFLIVVLAALAFAGSGCKSKQTAAIDTGPDYSRPLKPGQSALRLITDPARMPDLAGAYRNWNDNALVLDGLDQSLSWFAAPSSKQWFPFETISHEQAKASVLAFKEMLQASPDEVTFVNQLLQNFDVYESVGYNGEGIVLFTGYYAPIFDAETSESSRFRYPLYHRPEDLATDRVTGAPLGRMLPDGTTVPYFTRREIEESNMFAGNEIAWLEDPLSVYIVHVNGSAQLRLEDGSTMYVGYAGKTDKPYASLSQALIDEGMLHPNQRNLPAIRRVFNSNPKEVGELINRNECYVFFTQVSADEWPKGSLGRKVTSEVSLATDKSIYPRGGVVLVDTQAVTFSLGQRKFLRFMLDQDTGGAIKAPGRADIFMGTGKSAEILAGGQYAEGRLYYFFLKPQLVRMGK